MSGLRPLASDSPAALFGAHRPHCPLRMCLISLMAVHFLLVAAVRRHSNGHCVIAIILLERAAFAVLILRAESIEGEVLSE